MLQVKDLFSWPCLDGTSPVWAQLHSCDQGLQLALPRGLFIQPGCLYRAPWVLCSALDGEAGAPLACFI